jgi:hypothetical protein
MQLLITLLIWIVIFAIVAFGLLWICNRFFAEFPPARWICGAVLLIILLVAIAGQFPEGFAPIFRRS